MILENVISFSHVPKLDSWEPPVGLFSVELSPDKPKMVICFLSIRYSLGFGQLIQFTDDGNQIWLRPTKPARFTRDWKSGAM